MLPPAPTGKNATGAHFERRKSRGDLKMLKSREEAGIPPTARDRIKSGLAALEKGGTAGQQRSAMQSDSLIGRGLAAREAAKKHGPADHHLIEAMDTIRILEARWQAGTGNPPDIIGHAAQIIRQNNIDLETLGNSPLVPEIKKIIED